MIQWILTVLRAKASKTEHIYKSYEGEQPRTKLAVFILDTHYPSELNFDKHLFFCLAIKYKYGNKTRRPSDELAFVVPLSRLMRAVSALKLERHNQTNNGCLSKLFQTDNESSSTKTAILCVTRVSLYHTVKTICVAMLLIELQSPIVSVGNTIRTQMFHDESTRSKQINQLNILAAKHLKDNKAG